MLIKTVVFVGVRLSLSVVRRWLSVARWRLVFADAVVMAICLRAGWQMTDIAKVAH